MFPHLPGGLDSLPDTEVNQDPDSHQTQHHLPVDLTRFIQTRRDVQNFVSAETTQKSAPSDPT